MTTIVLDRARETLAAAEKANPVNQSAQVKKGDLQGRKVIPIEFYLHVAGALISGIAAIALTVAAIAFSTFILLAAVAACVLLCLVNALAASTINRLTPEKEIDSIIGKLDAKVRDLMKVNQDLKKDAQKTAQAEGKLQATADIKRAEKSDLKELDGKTELLNRYRASIADYAKKQRAENEILQNHLDTITKFFKDNGEDVSILEQLQQSIVKMTFDEEQDDPIEFFEKHLQQNHDIYNQFSALLPILEQYTNKLVQDYNGLQEINVNLESRIEELEEAKKEIERQLKEKEELISVAYQELGGSKLS